MRYFLLIFLLLCAATGRAQTYTDITTSDNFFYGEGSGSSQEEADQAAMKDLLTKIKTRVTVRDHIKNDRIEKNGNVVSDNTTFSATIEIASEGTLEGTQRLPLPAGPNEYKVLRYINKNDLNKMYDARRRKIHGYIDDADKFLRTGKIDAALRRYYWAYMLVKSMRLSGREEYKEHTLATWLPGRIEEILGDIKVTVTPHGNNEADIHFTYLGNPVSSIEFRYDDSGIYSNLCQAEDGNGHVEFSDELPDFYKIEIEYKYEAVSRSQDRDVYAIMSELGKPEMKNAYKAIKTTAGATTPPSLLSNDKNAFDIAASLPVASETSRKSALSSLEDENYCRPPLMDKSSIGPYKAVMDTLLASIVSRQYNPPRSIFTPEGYSKFRRLIKYGNSKFTGTPELRFSETPDGVVVRGIQLSFSFAHGARRHFTENLVFTMNKELKVVNVAFGLDKVTEDDILGRAAFPVENRQRIVQFMENYKTAYALKDWDYIEKIFDDDALIITGTVLRTSLRSEDNFYKNDEKIVYQRQSKNEYIERLKAQNKEFINLSFSHAEVVRPAASEEIYGIQIEQDYFSNNYSDHGYLMLAINYNDPERPLIFVRTWQPKPDPEFGTYSIQQFPFIAKQKAGI